MVFGMPIGPEHEEQIERRVLQVQRFERTRLELHTENRAPYDVELGRIGEEVLAQQGRDWRAFARVDRAPAGCTVFPQTGHSLCEPFLSYWRGQGLEFDGRRGTSEVESLALFGQPLSEPQIETNSSGDIVLTQRFERARFERHERNPINQEPLPHDRQVLLGLLGDEAGEHEEPTAQPTEPPHSEPTARPCDHEHDGCHHEEPTARPTEPPHGEPTARPTEHPHEPTATPKH